MEQTFKQGQVVDAGVYVPPEFWNMCGPHLKADLLGAYEAHGILSTRKAVASLRANPRIRNTLDAMTDTEIPPGDQDSKRTTNQELLSNPPQNIICSDCVWRTASAFLNEKKEFNAKWEEERQYPLVTEEAFLLKISGVSVGPMIKKWRADGYNTGKVAQLLQRFEGVPMQYTSGILPNPCPCAPPPTFLTPEEIAHIESVEPWEPPQLSLERMHLVKEAFAMFDRDGDGYISYSSLPYAFRFIGLPWNEDEGEQSHKSRKISYWNFEYLVKSRDSLRKDRPQSDPSLREWIRIYKTIDKDNKGITTSHLYKILSNLGEKAPSAEIEAMIKVADSNNDGTISMEEFIKLMIRIEDVKKQLKEEEEEGEEEKETEEASLEEELSALSDAIEQKIQKSERPNKRAILTESTQIRLKFADLVARVQEHIRLRQGNEEGLVVNSLYWMECDGILICKRNPNIEEEDFDKEEKDEVLVQGRLYAWQVMPYKEEWQTKKDPTDNVLYQEKMNFREFLETVIWPRLSEKERKELQEAPQVEFYNEEERKKYLISRANEEGKLLDADGKLLEAGLQMFVLGIDGSLYMGKKIKGVRHHTSFLAAGDVASAGMIVMNEKGGIDAIIARSGHYKPREVDMIKAVKKLIDIGACLKGVVIQYQPRLESPAEDLVKLDSLVPLQQVSCWKELKARFQRTAEKCK